MRMQDVSRGRMRACFDTVERRAPVYRKAKTRHAAGITTDRECLVAGSMRSSSMRAARSQRLGDVELGGGRWPLGPRPTSSTNAIGAASPLRTRVLRMRV